MNTKTIFLTAILVLSYLLNSCDLLREQNDIPSKQRNPTVTVIAIDGTGSYKYIDKAKNTAINYINSLPPESRIYVRWISENSVSDECSVVSAIIPRKPEQTRNAFNVKGKEEYLRDLKEYVANKKHIYQQIMDAQSPGAMHTDIWGAIFAATERFISGQNIENELLMLTDMQDNVRKSYKQLKLKKASVKIYDFQASENENFKSNWEKRLKAIGASSVEFAHIDEILTFNE